jgi:hypothetical protein
MYVYSELFQSSVLFLTVRQNLCHFLWRQPYYQDNIPPEMNETPHPSAELRTMQLVSQLVILTRPLLSSLPSYSEAGVLVRKLSQLIPLS